jgi:hypothetical protein
MTTMSTTIDGLLAWHKPPDVHALLRSGAGRSIAVRLRLDGHPWGEVNLTFDRPMSVDAAHERLDGAVEDLRKAVGWMAWVHAGVVTIPKMEVDPCITMRR